MKTRDIVIVMAVFYAIVIPASVIFMLYPEQEEKKRGLEIMMDKTVYKKGEIVEYTVRNIGDVDVWFSGEPIRTIIGDNVYLECCFVEVAFTMSPKTMYHETFNTNSNIIKSGEYTIRVKGATMNFTITD